MPRIRQITGSFIDLLKTMYPNQPGVFTAFTKIYSDQTSTILKDLTRQCFMPTNGWTYEDHMATWLTPKPTSYTQGDMVSGFFQVALQNFFFEPNPKFYQNEVRQGILPRTEENLEQYRKRDGRVQFQVAFYDDTGVPCGLYLSCSRYDPTLMVAAITRNANAAPAERQIMYLSSPELMDLRDEGLVDAATKATADFLTFLNSQHIKKIFQDNLLLQDGMVNIAALEELATQYRPSHTREQGAKVALLFRQEAEVRGWQLTEHQFAVVKAVLEAKQKKKRDKIEAWYPSWREANLPQIERMKQDIQRPESGAKAEWDARARQSFLNRNVADITSGAKALGVVALISFTLFLTGVFAPFVIILGTLTAVVADVVASGIKIRLKEKVRSEENIRLEEKVRLEEIELSTYLLKLASLDGSLEAVRQRKLQEIGQGMDITNDPQQIVQTVIAADFSDEEFRALEAMVRQAGQVDEVVQADQIIAPQVEEEPAPLSASLADFTAQLLAITEITIPSEPLEQAKEAVEGIPLPGNSPKSAKRPVNPREGVRQLDLENPQSPMMG